MPVLLHRKTEVKNNGFSNNNESLLLMAFSINNHSLNREMPCHKLVCQIKE